MGVFISYSSRDRHSLDGVLSALRRAREDVWFDEELGGGEVWWRMILERIRECDVFIFAISANSLLSKPCLAELGYARDLGKPILPVLIAPVDSTRVTPVADGEVIDYQVPSIDGGIRLITAVRDARGSGTPLPSPLPEEPPVPFAYLMRLATTVTSPDLSPRDQAHLVSELKSGLAEDGHDPTAREDITRLLTSLRDRPDVTYSTRTEIETLLASTTGPTTPPAHSQPPRPEPRPEASRRPALIWAVAGAAAVIAVIAAVVALTATRNHPPTQSAGPPAADTYAPQNSPVAASPDATVTFDGRQLPTTGRPECITATNRLIVMFAAPDAASRVMLTGLTDNAVETVVIPVDDTPFGFIVDGDHGGHASVTKAGEASWNITGEAWGVEPGAAEPVLKPFSIEVSCW